MCNLKNCCKGGCLVATIAQILVVIGGINWGLVGLGMLMGGEWNIVNILLGSWPAVEAVIYVLVGLAAAVQVLGCVCSKCRTASPGCCDGGEGNNA